MTATKESQREPDEAIFGHDLEQGAASRCENGSLGNFDGDGFEVRGFLPSIRAGIKN